MNKLKNLLKTFFLGLMGVTIMVFGILSLKWLMTNVFIVYPITLLLIINFIIIFIIGYTIKKLFDL